MVACALMPHQGMTWFCPLCLKRHISDKYCSLSSRATRIKPDKPALQALLKGKRVP